MAPPGGRRCPWPSRPAGDGAAAEGGSVQGEPWAASKGEEGAAALAAASPPPPAASPPSSALHAAAAQPSSALHAAAAQPSPSSAYPQHAQPR